MATKRVKWSDQIPKPHKTISIKFPNKRKYVRTETFMGPNGDVEIGVTDEDGNWKRTSSVPMKSRWYYVKG